MAIVVAAIGVAGGLESGLGPEVSARIQPWRAFAQSSTDASLRDTRLNTALPAEDLAYAFRRLLLGLEILSHLDEDSDPALALFTLAKKDCPVSRFIHRVRQLGGILMTSTLSTNRPRSPSNDTGLDVVTGAFSSSGSAIGNELLANGRSVRTLTGHPERGEGDRGTEARRVDFDDPLALVKALRGCDHPLQHLPKAA